MKRRFASKLQFYTNYTLSYNRDDDSNERNFAGITYENAFNLADEFRWGRSDIRHRWGMSGIYDLPLGFQIGTIAEWRTGSPFSAFTGGDSNGDGQFTDKPIISGIPLLRNAFRQPNFFNQDLRLTKNFRIREGHQIALIFEMFNLWNNENLSFGVSTNESTTTALGSRGALDKRHSPRSEPSTCPMEHSIAAGVNVGTPVPVAGRREVHVLVRRFTSGNRGHEVRLLCTVKQMFDRTATLRELLRCSILFWVAPERAGRAD